MKKPLSQDWRSRSTQVEAHSLHYTSSMPPRDRLATLRFLRLPPLDIDS